MQDKKKFLDCSSPSDVSECARLVKAGGVVVFPTDTVYGIGCDPYDSRAVARVFEIKGRDERKPLPVLVADVHVAESLVELGGAGRRLAALFWPGALTIVAPLKDKKISPRVTAGKDSLAVRVPANDCVLALLRQCRMLVGTSANPSGGGSCRTARQVAESLSGYDALLAAEKDGTATGGAGVESTIVDITGGSKPTIARQGAVPADAIMAALSDDQNGG
ncbi:L-threonylcarbamoyladenylate synthase [Nitrososphaera sp.]|uniref:L-threonylcarbamoyladenylate synthase n=1 Tax=Nitrososphaera sp. TaxID=1971748 RepID=UPI00307E9F2C